MTRYLTRDEQAAYLNDKGLRVSKTTLQKLATTGNGPQYVIFGNRALSTTEWLDSWAESKLKPRSSTSEAA